MCCAYAVARRDVEAELVSLLESHAGRPDFDAAFDDLAGLQPLPFIVSVVWAKWQRAFGIELAVRRAQPAFGHACDWVAALTDFADVFAVRSDVANSGEDVHVLARARDPQVKHERPRYLHILRHRRGFERYAAARGLRLAAAGGGRQFARGWRGRGSGRALSRRVGARWGALAPEIQPGPL